MERLLFIFLELGWGILYAIALQRWQPFPYLAREETWLTVVIGTGVTGLLAGITGYIAWPVIGQVGIAFALSAIGIIARSLINNERRWHERWLTIRDSDDQQS